jgi:L-ascorbate metabolism protein UlaG (beta-lactamase superfamily)
MQFTYYGHSCFLLHFDGIKILFDPFISENQLASEIDIESIEADYILLSHGHYDHLLDIEAISLRTGAKVVCSWEIHEWLNKKGISNTHPMNIGGQWNFDNFKLKCVAAQHSSSLPDGSYGGSPMGFVLFGKNKTCYYSGDTALTLEMQLIPLWGQIDFAILPIGDNFTMGIEDACRAAEFVKTTKVIGVHFNTFEFIKINHEEAIQHFASHNIQLNLPIIGRNLSL